MATVTEALVDAKNEARQAETRTEIADALLKVLEGQRQSDRAAFRLGMWMITSVFTAAGGGGHRNRSSPMTRRP